MNRNRNYGSRKFEIWSVNGGERKEKGRGRVGAGRAHLSLLPFGHLLVLALHGDNKSEETIVVKQIKRSVIERKAIESTERAENVFPLFTVLVY